MRSSFQHSILFFTSSLVIFPYIIICDIYWWKIRYAASDRHTRVYIHMYIYVLPVPPPRFTLVWTTQYIPRHVAPRHRHIIRARCSAAASRCNGLLDRKSRSHGDDEAIVYSMCINEGLHKRPHRNDDAVSIYLARHHHSRQARQVTSIARAHLSIVCVAVRVRARLCEFCKQYIKPKRKRKNKTKWAAKHSQNTIDYK